MSEDAAPLRGRTVAVPESRQLEVLAALLESRGAIVVRCPLVAIKDAEDERSVVAWIERFSADPPAVVILYTGEGVDRLAGYAERAGLKDRFVAALARTRTLTRGPKPKRALRGLGLAPTLEAPEPTTDGIVAALEPLPLEGRRIGVQLYGTEPVPALTRYLASRRAEADCVAPYTYATAADDASVEALIRRLSRHDIDAITFTSSAQVDRLRQVAAKCGLGDALAQGLAAACVAAVGPVVRAELEAAQIRVDAVPEQSFHMKPLVNALIEALARR